MNHDLIDVPDCFERLWAKKTGNILPSELKAEFDQQRTWYLIWFIFGLAVTAVFALLIFEWTRPDQLSLKVICWACGFASGGFAYWNFCSSKSGEMQRKKEIWDQYQADLRCFLYIFKLESLQKYQNDEGLLRRDVEIILTKLAREISSDIMRGSRTQAETKEYQHRELYSYASKFDLSQPQRGLYFPEGREPYLESMGNTLTK